MYLKIVSAVLGVGQMTFCVFLHQERYSINVFKLVLVLIYHKLEKKYVSEKSSQNAPVLLFKQFSLDNRVFCVCLPNPCSSLCSFET